MRDDQIRRITDALTLLECKIKGRSVANLTDINIVSEDFFSEFLNELRGLSLRNVNSDKSNHPAIDLADVDNRIAFQITSTKTASKVQGTIDKFVEHGLDEDYDDLYILVLGDRQNKYTTINPKGTCFDSDRHIIDIKTLIREISCGQSVARLKALERLVLNENLVADLPANKLEDGPPDQAVLAAKRIWSKDPRFSSIAIACLIGQWREDREGDRAIIETFLADGYTAWLREIRSVLQEPDSPLKLKNGVWSVVDRGSLWKDLSGCIFDEDLDHLKQAAEVVLVEVDPKFDIPVEDRLFNFENKKNRYSETIRKGIAEALAYLGRNGDMFTQSSQHKAITVALLATRTVLGSDDFRLWGSINNLLPYLAEASPDEFLTAVERTATIKFSPFVELFNQEQGGAFSQHYLTGLLWGLELVAWEDAYLTRASVTFAVLAGIDPGGQYSNRPGNSLTEIFLPWFPQTLATFDQQMIAMRTLQREFPSILGDLLLSLLPKGHTSSSGTYTPKFIELTEEQKSPKITNAEYWNRITEIANLAFELGAADKAFLEKLAGEIDHLPIEFQDRLIEFLESVEGSKLLEENFSNIWKTLGSIVMRHRKYSDADWALPSDRADALDEFVKSIEPKRIEEMSERLFKQDEYDLYEEKGDWQAQRERLQQRRNDAISAIVESVDLEAVIAFSKQVEAPYRVGYSLGCVSNAQIDGDLLPRLLGDDLLSSFMNGYINSRHHPAPWGWVDAIEKTGWSISQLSCLCLSLPFTTETWVRVDEWLSDSAQNYWTEIEFNPHQADGDLLFAVDALLEAGRPLRAIDCLQCMLHNEEPLDVARTVNALVEAINTQESAARMDQYDVIQLIGALQDSSKTAEEDLMKIEWAYLRLLDGHSGGRPKTLYHKLSSDPLFFCEILRMVYKSDDESENKNSETDESTKIIAKNAWHLLYGWNRAPGVDDDGNLDVEVFQGWISRVIETCRSTGHLGIGLDQIGKALFYCPAEADGSLWIASAAANTLNEAEFDDMRKGYSCEASNSRGAHSPSVKASMDLYGEWLGKAEAVEADGFHRFSTELRSLAGQYLREAERLKNRDPFEY